MSPPTAPNQPAAAPKPVTAAVPKYAHKHAEALLRQLKTASTAVTSTASQSLSLTKQLDLIGSLFNRANSLYASPKVREAFSIVSNILAHIGSVELPSLGEKLGMVGAGRQEALQEKREAWERLIEGILRSLKSFAQTTDLAGKQVLGNECFAALVDLFQKCGDSTMVRRRILDVFDAGIQGGVAANKKLLVENSLFADLSGEIFANASDQGLVERILDITIRLVKATTTPKDWIASVFDVKHYRGDADERDCRRAEFEKVDLKNYDEKVAAFMTVLSKRNPTNFQPIFLLHLSANNLALSNCDGDADGKDITFGANGHFNLKSFTVVTTKEVGDDFLQQILEVDYPFRRIVVDVSPKKPASVTIFASRIKLDSAILASLVNQAESTVAFSIRSSDIDSLKEMLDARKLAFEIRGHLPESIHSVIPAKRPAENQVNSTKGKQNRKNGIVATPVVSATTHIAPAPTQIAKVSKIPVVFASPKSANKSKWPTFPFVESVPPKRTAPTTLLKPTTPQKSVQFSSPAVEAAQATSKFLSPIPTQRRDFLTADGVESSPSSATEVRHSLVDYLPYQNQLSIRSSQIIVKPKGQKRQRESYSQNLPVKKQKKKQRRSVPRLIEVESATEDRLSAALEDLFSMISKSVGRTSTRNRKTKSNFEIWATRKAMEIERENHHQTGLILQKTRGMIEGIQQSSDRARHEIYETQKLLGGKENGGAV